MKWKELKTRKIEPNNQVKTQPNKDCLKFFKSDSSTLYSPLFLIFCIPLARMDYYMQDKDMDINITMDVIKKSRRLNRPVEFGDTRGKCSCEDQVHDMISLLIINIRQCRSKDIS